MTRLMHRTAALYRRSGANVCQEAREDRERWEGDKEKDSERASQANT